MRPMLLGFSLLMLLLMPSTLRAGREAPWTGDPPSGTPSGAPAASNLNGSWSLLAATPGARPAPRMSMQVIVDPLRDEMVLFGGWGGLYFNDTWSMDLSVGDSWQPVPTAGPVPAPRLEHTGVYDPVRHRMLSFGGKDPFNNEVWALTLSGTPTWSLLRPSGTPPVPRESRAIYDPVRDRMILFGGFTPARHLNDTWALDLSGTLTWSELHPTGEQPAPRRGHTVNYDAAGDRLILFGGYDDENFWNDVWALDLGSLVWQRLTPAGTAPSGRYGHSATYDPVRREIVVFAGFDGQFLSDTHVLSLAGAPTWTNVSMPFPPFHRDFHGVVYDAPRQRMVLFGGNFGPVRSDVWAFDTATRTWSFLTPLQSDGPPPRLGSYAVLDSDSRRMVLFGGWGNFYLADTWTLPLDADPPLWVRSTLSGFGPKARLEHATAYDSARDRMLLFGGKDATQFFDDVWQLDLRQSPKWSAVITEGQPPSPRECRAVYDPVRDRMLFVGGFSPPNHLNEVWSLDLSGTPTWSQLSPQGRAPASRRGQSVIYDPVHDRLVMFGGYDDTRFYSDLWELRLSGPLVWVELHPPGTGPGPRYGHSATYDPDRHGMVVIGGFDGRWLEDAHFLSLRRPGGWSQIEADPRPGPTDFHSVIHDPVRHRFLLYGGNDGRPLGALWALTLPGEAVQSQAGPASTLQLSGFATTAAAQVPVLRFALSDGSPARLELFDVAGRRVSDRMITSPAAGRHEVRLEEARTLRAGIYLVRLTQGSQRAVARGVVVP